LLPYKKALHSNVALDRTVTPDNRSSRKLNRTLVPQASGLAKVRLCTQRVGLEQILARKYPPSFNGLW
jgi:hypothetical protein